jgi:ribose transport system substrate-binding protein
MKLSRLVALFLVGLIALAPVSCGGRSSKKQVAFITNNTHEFWTIVERGFEKGAKESNVEGLFRRPSDNSTTKQKEIIDSLLAQGVDAIAISVIDPKNQRDFLDRVAAKVPLLAVDTDAPDSKRLCYLGTDNHAAGKDAGELVKKALPNGGTVAIFVGNTDSLNAVERWQGVLDALAGTDKAVPDQNGKVGKYTLVRNGDSFNPFTDSADPKKINDNPKNVLLQVGPPDDLCMVGLYAYNPPAIYAAARNRGLLKKIKIVGFDEDKETLRGIEEGDIIGTVVQQPYKFGLESAKLMAALAEAKTAEERAKLLPEGGKMPIPHRVVTQENVVTFRQELDEQMGK